MSGAEFVDGAPPADGGRHRLLLAAQTPARRERAGGGDSALRSLKRAGPFPADRALIRHIRPTLNEALLSFVLVVRRSAEMLRLMETPEHRQRLRDPDSTEYTQQPEYARNAWRSINAEYFVVIGICTHLGCVPNFRPEVAPEDLGPAWVGGYFCPCHGSRHDLAGRVYSGVPAPTNLVVPPHHFHTTTMIEIGIDYEYSFKVIN